MEKRAAPTGSMSCASSGGIAWVAWVSRTTSTGGSACAVKCSRPSWTVSLAQVSRATRWERRSAEGILHSSHTGLDPTTCISSGSSQRSQSGQSRVVPSRALRPSSSNTHARSWKGGRWRTCWPWRQSISATQSPSSSQWKPVILRSIGAAYRCDQVIRAEPPVR